MEEIQFIYVRIKSNQYLFEKIFKGAAVPKGLQEWENLKSKHVFIYFSSSELLESSVWLTSTYNCWKKNYLLLLLKLECNENLANKSW